MKSVAVVSETFASRSRRRQRPRAKWRLFFWHKRNWKNPAYLKRAEPFLEPRGWLDGGDASPLLALAIGRPDVAERGGRGRARHDSRRAGTSKKKKKRLLGNIQAEYAIFMKAIIQKGHRRHL